MHELHRIRREARYKAALVSIVLVYATLCATSAVVSLVHL